METEINTLKELYLSTIPPESLDSSGVQDLFSKIDSSLQTHNIYFSKYALIGSLVGVVLLTGFGTATAQSKPPSIFYPIKQLAQKLTTTVPHFNPNQIGDSVKSIFHRKNTNSSPTTGHTTDRENEKEEKENNTDVKGVSTNQEELNNSSNASESGKNKDSIQMTIEKQNSSQHKEDEPENKLSNPNKNHEQND